MIDTIVSFLENRKHAVQLSCSCKTIRKASASLLWSRFTLAFPFDVADVEPAFLQEKAVHVRSISIHHIPHPHNPHSLWQRVRGPIPIFPNTSELHVLTGVGCPTVAPFLVPSLKSLHITFLVGWEGSDVGLRRDLKAVESLGNLRTCIFDAVPTHKGMVLLPPFQDILQHLPRPGMLTSFKNVSVGLPPNFNAFLRSLSSLTDLVVDGRSLEHAPNAVPLDLFQIPHPLLLTSLGFTPATETPFSFHPIHRFTNLQDLTVTLDATPQNPSDLGDLSHLRSMRSLTLHVCGLANILTRPVVVTLVEAWPNICKLVLVDTQKYTERHRHSMVLQVDILAVIARNCPQLHYLRIPLDGTSPTVPSAPPYGICRPVDVQIIFYGIYTINTEMAAYLSRLYCGTQQINIYHEGTRYLTWTHQEDDLWD